MVVNGITYKNAKIRRKKTKNNISVVKDVKIQHNEEKSDLKVVKTNKVIEVKQIDKRNFYCMNSKPNFYLEEMSLGSHTC